MWRKRRLIKNRQIERKLAKHDVDVIQAGTKKEGGGNINTAGVTER